MRTATLLFHTSVFCMALLLVGCSSMPGPNIKTPGPDFGFIPDSIGIVDTGKTYVETSVEFDHKDSDSSERVPILLRVGTSKDWELRAQTWLVQRDQNADDTITGSGPLQLGFKRRFNTGEQRFFSPAWGIEMEFLLPLGSAEFHDNKFQPSLTFNFDHWVSEFGTFTWNLGVFTPVDETEGQFLQGFLAAAYAHFITPDIQLYITGSLNSPATKSGEQTDSVIGVGGYWYTSSRFALYLGYNTGMTADSTDGAGVVGLAYAL